MKKEDFKIGTYKVSPSTRSIKVGGEMIHLQPKVMDLLCYLSQNANNVISRDELITHVWKGVIVSDDAIHRTISILRSVLKDDPKNPEYLETITKTGYRIIASVRYDKGVLKNSAEEIKRHNPFVALPLVILIIVLIALVVKDNSIKINVPKFSYLTSHNGLEYAPQISPVTNEIIYSQYDKGWEGSFIIDSKVGSLPKKQDIDKRFIDSIWSPDGKAIYSHENTTQSCNVVKHFLSGLPSQQIGDCITKSRGMLFYMDVSVDDKFIIISERNNNISRRLYEINVKTGERKSFFKNTDGIGDYFPKYSPDNKWLAFARGFTANSRELMIVPITGGKAIQLTTDDAFIQDLVWTSDNNIVFISNRESGINGLWYMDLDASEPIWLNTIIDGIDRIDISHDDKFLAYQTWYQPFNVYQLDLNKLEEGMNSGKALSISKKENNFPSVSPDGQYLSYISNKTGNYGLWLTDTNGENPKLLVDNVHKYAAPEWSADSKQLSFTILNEGQGDICITNLEGKYSCITHSKEDELFSSWSKDQESIYYTKLIPGDDSHYINYRYELSSRAIVETGIEKGLNIKESNQASILYYNEAVTSNIFKFNTITKQKEIIIDDFYDVYYKSWFVADSGIYYYSKNKELRFYNFYSKEITTLMPMSKIGGYGTSSGLYVDTKEQTLILSLSPMTLNGDIGLVENFSELLPQ